jgi:hypothetical protein
MPIFRATINALECALIHQIRQMQTNGFRGCLELHFPGQGGPYKFRIVRPPEELEIDKQSEEALCQSESK